MPESALKSLKASLALQNSNEKMLKNKGATSYFFLSSKFCPR